MARNIEDIKKQIRDQFVSEYAAIGKITDPSTWGMFNRRRIWTNIVAFVIWFLETLFDTFKQDVNDTIARKKPPRFDWYIDLVKSFQHGFPLIAESDQFDNTGYTDEQIAASKIIAYAAVVKQKDAFNHGYLRFKVAKLDGDGNLVKLADAEKEAVIVFLEKTLPAGDDFILDSNDPDNIKETWRLFYDPLVLAANGSRIDGTGNTPAQDAIKEYLVNLSFNGVFDAEKQVDKVQDIQGIIEAKLDICQTQYGLFDWQSVDVFYTPDAGYLRFASDNDLTVEFIAYGG